MTNDLYSAFDVKALVSTKQCGKKKTLFNFIKSLNCYFNELGIQSGSCSPPTLCCQGGAELREAASLMGSSERVQDMMYCRNSDPSGLGLFLLFISNCNLPTTTYHLICELGLILTDSNLILLSTRIPKI